MGRTSLKNDTDALSKKREVRFTGEKKVHRGSGVLTIKEEKEIALTESASPVRPRTRRASSPEGDLLCLRKGKGKRWLGRIHDIIPRKRGH